MSISQPLGDLIKYLRKKQDITQEDLAARSGVSSATISKLEQGEKQPRIETLIDIAEDGLNLSATPIFAAIISYKRGAFRTMVEAYQKLTRDKPQNLR